MNLPHKSAHIHSKKLLYHATSTDQLRMLPAPIAVRLFGLVHIAAMPVYPACCTAVRLSCGSSMCCVLLAAGVHQVPSEIGEWSCGIGRASAAAQQKWTQTAGANSGN
jgi:hypothetical protein